MQSNKRRKSSKGSWKTPIAFLAIAIFFLYRNLKMMFIISTDKDNDASSNYMYGYNGLITQHDKCTSDGKNYTCIDDLWRGNSKNTLNNNDNNNKFEVSVVVSYCKADFRKIMEYLNNRNTTSITIKSIKIIARCPLDMQLEETHIPDNVEHIGSRWRNPTLDFLQYFDTFRSTHHNNHYILFINDVESIRGRYYPRTVDEILQASIEDGFGCLQRPQFYNSYYHDSATLRSFNKLNTTNTDFGDWYDRYFNSNILFDKLIPTCYGSSFAIQSHHLLHNANQYASSIKDIKKHELESSNKEQTAAFLERTWASIFSYPLSKNNIKFIRNHAVTGINLDNCCHHGALLHDFKDHYFFDFFTGGILQPRKQKQEITTIDYSKLRLSLVISHCNEDMTWMTNYTQNLSITNITIYSKCGKKINGYKPSISNIIRMPNIGRCDHSYAHYMKNYLKQSDDNNAITDNDNSDENNHIVLFIKASRVLIPFALNYRPLSDVIQIAKIKGFGCESVTNKGISAYSDYNLLRKFKLAQYKGDGINSTYTNYGHWVDEIGMDLPKPYIQVCYGGNFAVKASQIKAYKHVWDKLEPNLSRGNSIEEGHFAERAWAGLLSSPLTLDELYVLENTPTEKWQTMEHIGTLRLKNLRY